MGHLIVSGPGRLHVSLLIGKHPRVSASPARTQTAEAALGSHRTRNGAEKGRVADRNPRKPKFRSATALKPPTHAARSQDYGAAGKISVAQRGRNAAVRAVSNRLNLQGDRHRNRAGSKGKRNLRLRVSGSLILLRRLKVKPVFYGCVLGSPLHAGAKKKRGRGEQCQPWKPRRLGSVDLS